MAKRNRIKILFVYDHEYPHLWRDGLWAALQILLKDFDIVTCNLQTEELFNHELYDFVLGWGGFESRVDRAIRELPIRKGLCIGGNAFPPVHANDYDVLFYETDWYRPFIESHKNIVKAFGVNTKIYYPKETDKVFDIISVGAFANWKRHYLLKKYNVTTLAIGQLQQNNMDESMMIVTMLLASGVIVSDMKEPEVLANLYRASNLCYIPADINGGGERAILEAMACGIMVDCEDDNEKLKELTLLDKVPTEKNYAAALKYGINSTL